MKQPNWSEWNKSEFLQLDQYDKQHMFRQPVLVTNKSANFHLVWTYVIKELDSQKKARCVCNRSPWSGQIRILDHTYPNCVNRTGSWIFYPISATENMLIYSANILNALVEAPPPSKASTYIRTVLLKNGGLLS